MTFIHEKNIPAFLCHFSFWSTWMRQGQNVPKHCEQQRKNTWTRSFKHWPSGSSGQYFQRKKHTHTYTHSVFPMVQTLNERMHARAHAHTHTHTHRLSVPYGADPEWMNARTHARTRTHTHSVFPMVQTQNERMHAYTHTHTHTHTRSLWCRDRTQVARAHECWKAESCPGREPGGLAHAPEAPPYNTRESAHTGNEGTAPGLPQG